MMTTVLQSPSYIVGPDGQPAAVLLDWVTWKSLIGRLEDVEDNDILHAAAAEIDALAHGQWPAGWKSWEEFEAELDAQEAAGELPA